MADREKVIRGLECCFDAKCKECPYQDGLYCKAIPKKEKAMIDIPSWLARDALSLLKAQEPEHVSIKDSDGGETHWYVCGSCKAPINPGDKYCHECGKAVKWNER